MWNLRSDAGVQEAAGVCKQIARHNQPPFTVVNDGHREVLTGWRDLLAYVKTEGMRDAQVQRYKGLGEMNAEQLWETTMNPEKRTLLQVRLEDLVAVRGNLLHADGRGRREPPEVHRRRTRSMFGIWTFSFSSKSGPIGTLTGRQYVGYNHLDPRSATTRQLEEALALPGWHTGWRRSSNGEIRHMPPPERILEAHRLVYVPTLCLRKAIQLPVERFDVIRATAYD